MDEKTMQPMTKMVDAIQPHCDEQIVAAMTCSRAGSILKRKPSMIWWSMVAPRPETRI